MLTTLYKIILRIIFMLEPVLFLSLSTGCRFQQKYYLLPIFTKKFAFKNSAHIQVYIVRYIPFCKSRCKRTLSVRCTICNGCHWRKWNPQSEFKSWTTVCISLCANVLEKGMNLFSIGADQIL